MNKPVAWISRLPEGDVYNCAWAEKQNDDDIPLYTHPVKELTDEEMMKAEYEFMYWNRSLEKPLVEIAYELGVFKQAVAILRKAQEK